MRTYITAYFGAWLVAMMLMPLVVRMARVLCVVDHPGVRKIHHDAIPRIGGLPIIAGVLAMMLGMLLLDNDIGRLLRGLSPEIPLLLVTSGFMFIVGLVDDVRGISARVKFSAQLLAAAVLCAFGIRIDSISFGGLTIEFGLWAWPITMLWIVGITNAVNLIDGLDGLAAGIGAIACGAITVFAIYTSQVVMAVLMLTLLGSLTGFLLFNFNPAKIFLGDCGTLFVGFFIASASVMCATKSVALAGLGLPVLALGLPIFDTLFSMFRRVLARRSVFAPDKDHIHHRLLTRGVSHRTAVIIMYLITLLAAGMGMLMMVLRDGSAAIVFAVVLVFILTAYIVVGGMNLRAGLDALRSDIKIVRESRQEKRSFEDLELKLREVESFDEWWGAMCLAAQEMDFLWMTAVIKNGRPVGQRIFWRKPNDSPSGRIINMSLPPLDLGDGYTLRIDAAVKVNGSLEAAGRRATLFERLIDERDVPVIAHDMSECLARPA